MHQGASTTLYQIGEQKQTLLKPKSSRRFRPFADVDTLAFLHDARFSVGVLVELALMRKRFQEYGYRYS
jgi:hypothetical protein